VEFSFPGMQEPHSSIGDRARPLWLSGCLMIKAHAMARNLILHLLELESSLFAKRVSLDAAGRQGEAHESTRESSAEGLAVRWDQ
jgi:hypothetical protein